MVVPAPQLNTVGALRNPTDHPNRPTTRKKTFVFILYNPGCCHCLPVGQGSCAGTTAGLQAARVLAPLQGAMPPTSFARVAAALCALYCAAAAAAAAAARNYTPPANWTYPTTWNPLNQTPIPILQPDGSPCSSFVVNHAPPPASANAARIQVSFVQHVGVIRNNTIVFINSGTLVALTSGGSLTYLAGGPQATSTTFPGVATATSLATKKLSSSGLQVAKDGVTVYFGVGCGVFRVNGAGMIDHLAGVIDESSEDTSYEPDGVAAVKAHNNCWLGLALAE